MRKLRRWQVLENLVKTHGFTSLAEIGVFKGQTAAHLLKTCPSLHWIGVDHWTPGDRDTPAALKKTEADEGFRSYRQHPLDAYRRNVEALALRHAGRATVYPMPSIEAAAQIEDGSLDAVFLDGDHTSAGVEADIVAWYPKLRENSVMTGHDHDLQAVANAIDRLLPGYEKHSDSVWSIHWRDIDPGRWAVAR